MGRRQKAKEAAKAAAAAAVAKEKAAANKAGESSGGSSAKSSGASAPESSGNRKEKEKYLPLFMRRPIPSPTEQPTRFHGPQPPAPPPNATVPAYGYPAGFNPNAHWPHPVFGPTPPPPPPTEMIPGSLPTVSWLCSCELCINSVQEFITALNSTNGQYAACIQTAGPIYNELVTAGIHVPSPTTGKLMPPGSSIEAATTKESGEAAAVADTVTTLEEKKESTLKAAAAAAPMMTVNYLSHPMPYYPVPVPANAFMGPDGIMYFNNNWPLPAQETENPEGATATDGALDEIKEAGDEAAEDAPKVGDEEEVANKAEDAESKEEAKNNDSADAAGKVDDAEKESVAITASDSAEEAAIENGDSAEEALSEKNTMTQVNGETNHVNEPCVEENAAEKNDAKESILVDKTESDDDDKAADAQKANTGDNAETGKLAGGKKKGSITEAVKEMESIAEEDEEEVEKDVIIVATMVEEAVVTHPPTTNGSVDTPSDNSTTDEGEEEVVCETTNSSSSSDSEMDANGNICMKGQVAIMESMNKLNNTSGNTARKVASFQK